MARKELTLLELVESLREAYDRGACLYDEDVQPIVEELLGNRIEDLEEKLRG